MVELIADDFDAAGHGVLEDTAIKH